MASIAIRARMAKRLFVVFVNHLLTTIETVRGHMVAPMGFTGR